MEPESGNFNQLQLSRRSRSKSSIWRAKDVEAASIGPASRRSTVRDSVMSVADMWAQGRPRDSVDSARTSLDRTASQTSISTRGQEIRRWDGVKRATTAWDEIRRDPELWFPDGDCFIHFYGRGSSRRGPSLRLHRDDLENAGCMRMLSKFADTALIEEDEEEEFTPVDEDTGPDGGFRSNPNTRGKDELFIPAPPLLNRDEALKFHVTTRNFFACIYEKPMVGTHLGESLVLVHERFNMYRPDKERNRDDMLQYCDDQGYTDFRDCPDHAMAMMYYSEKLRETDLWTEAFVHCVGMYDILNTAVEFPTVSRTIGALITRAHLEMTLRLEHAYADLGGFMEDSITSAYPKLPESALKHLERFRGFLQSFYVQQHGYWPPPSLTPGADFSVVTKSLLRSMYNDLRNLYLFLRDPKSEPKPTQAQIETYKAIYGGLVTPQLISGFDRRFKHSPLPNPLPLLPSSTSRDRSPAGGSYALAGLDVAGTAKPASGGAFARFLKPSTRKSAKALNTLNMLSAATNTNDPDVMDSLLVQEYSRFERDWTVRAEEKYDPVEARKVRWLLIYALLQTIIGVIATPREISSSEKVEYPLCVQTGGTPPWHKRMKVKAVMDGAATPILDALSTASTPDASPFATPRSSMARSGAITPISAADSIPPVPQLVLSELDKLARPRGSFSSDRDDSRSPRPPGSDANSIASGNTARPGKSALKSSSASIRSTGSTRSSFSYMMNRSLSFSTSMNYPEPSERERERSYNKPPKKEKEQKKEEKKEERKEKPKEQRPQVQKQKSAPPAVHTSSSADKNKKLQKNQATRGSMWSWNRSRQGSRQVSPERTESPAPRSAMKSPTPSSPAQSTFSNARGSVRFENTDSETPATSEFPQSATSVRSPLSAQPMDSNEQEDEETPKETTKQILHLVPLATIGAEPERGRSTHAPWSPTAANAASKKVRNFSRGRSMERPSPVSPVPPELPPLVPAGSKPQSQPTSPAESPSIERRTYTDAGIPPQLPTSTKPPSRSASQVRSPGAERQDFYDDQSPPPMPSHSKPRSRGQSMSHSPERELEDELPPPLPTHSKPGSRSQSPAPAAERHVYTDSALPPRLPSHSKPNSRSASVSRPAKADASAAPAIPNHSRPASRSQSRTRLPQIDTQTSAAPPVPTRSKPTTRQASPIRAPISQIQSSWADEVQSAVQSVESPIYQSAVESPIRSPHSLVASQQPLPNSRSMALRSAEQQAQAPAKLSAVHNVRPASDISQDTASAEAPRSASVSPVSPAAHSPDTSAEYLQRGTAVGLSHPSYPSSASRQAQQLQSVGQPKSRAADNPDRQYQRAPASKEHHRFPSDARAVITEEGPRNTNTETSHTATTTSKSVGSEWPLRSPTLPINSSSAYPTISPSLPPNLPLPPVPTSSAAAPRSPPQAPRTLEPSYQQALREHEERRARLNTTTSDPRDRGDRRGASRESKYRRAAWADLGPRNEANGMPLPPPQVRQHAAPIVRDARDARRFQGRDDEESLTSSEEEGVDGGLLSYGVMRGIMG